MTPPPEMSEKELCTIRIMFPIDSDEQAIEIKKKIKDALSDKSDAQIQFTITPIPSRMPLG